jgi:hypothetical protein
MVIDSGDIKKTCVANITKITSFTERYLAAIAVAMNIKSPPIKLTQTRGSFR